MPGYTDPRQSKGIGLFDWLPDFGPSVTDQALANSQRVRDVATRQGWGAAMHDPVSGALGAGLAGQFDFTSPVGLPGAAAGIFAGPKAATADLGKLELAQGLDKLRIPPEMIHRQTGWFKGIDGKWRFEIDDSAANMRENAPHAVVPTVYSKVKEYFKTLGGRQPKNLKGYMKRSEYENALAWARGQTDEASQSMPGTPIDKVFQHDELYAAYPDLRRIETIVDAEHPSYTGYFLQNPQYNPTDPPGRLMYGGGRQDPESPETRSTVLHELQHAIQRHEGFARGGSPTTALKAFVQHTNRKMEDLQRRIDLSTDPVEQRRLTYEMFDVMDQGKKMTPMEAYKRMAGETEARTVEARKDLGPIERQFWAPPMGAGDRPPEQQIVRFRNDGTAAQVPPEVARTLNTKRELPTDPLFQQAVANTPGAEITPDGLKINLWRGQKELQAGDQSVRESVFYLPGSAKNRPGYGSGKYNYGGPMHVRGDTQINRPLFVKGATGGKAPAAAYDQLVGKGAYERMRGDVMKATPRYGFRASAAQVAAVLKQYGADPNMAGHIVDNSRHGNQLAYAMQEAIVAAKVRKAGYDGVLGYSMNRARKPFISEWMDTRETTYPTASGETEIHPAYTGIGLGK